MIWWSEVEEWGPIEFPAPSGIRILMMPFMPGDMSTIPWESWGNALSDHIKRIGWDGYLVNCPNTCYLTIDERLVEPGEHHRRPGLHVDGWHRDGIWGGGGPAPGGIWGGKESGMLVGASKVGCEAWLGTFGGEPKEYGDCDHLSDQLMDDFKTTLKANTVYRMNSMCVHRTIPATEPGWRQFVRISGPSNAGWPDNCTPSPFGIQPSGPILPPRPKAFTRHP